jgi:predicted glycoside hydrolase/deacetylase ChbG (UPF0249 family)
MSAALKTLIVNADDFGFTHDVNAGIVEAHRRGILTSTTIMATGAAFDDAVRLAREHPALDIGCHLTLVQGPGLPDSVSGLIHALAARRMDAYQALRGQVVRVLEAGLRPSHLDTHKHTHLLPPVLDAVGRISTEFQIRWVRRPFDLPSPGPWAARAVSRCMGLVRGRFQAALARRGCRTTDHFAGFGLTGRFRANELAALIRSLPAGVTEFMCHPGRCTDELRCARTRLKESREVELEALIAPEVRRALEESNVRLASFRDL